MILIWRAVAHELHIATSHAEASAIHGSIVASGHGAAIATHAANAAAAAAIDRRGGGAIVAAAAATGYS